MSKYGISINIVVLKKFAIFTRKHLCWSLKKGCNPRLMVCNFIKTRLRHRCVFFCEYCKIFKKSFFHRTPAWLLLGLKEYDYEILLLQWMSSLNHECHKKEKNSLEILKFKHVTQRRKEPLSQKV